MFHHVFTPPCLWSTMSMFHCVLTPPCPCVNVPPCLSFILSLFHHVYVLPCLCSTAFLFHNIYVPPCLYSTMSMCLCCTVSMLHRVFAPPCLCSNVSLFPHHVSVPPCHLHHVYVPYVFTPPCLCSTVSLLHHQPWCDPMWLTGLKAPTHSLTKLLHHIPYSTMSSFHHWQKGSMFHCVFIPLCLCFIVSTTAGFYVPSYL